MAEHTIHILPENVANQIAAGEVVERPASALKELVENALDAAARTIHIEIARGGIDLISVADDGHGMSAQDAVIALRRHATSKIRSVEDLAAIRSMGFRGEALASIASVSRLELKTRRPQDETGTLLSVEGGATVRRGECAMAPGTRIEVRDLFFNTPARLKFLKSPTAEQSAAVEAVQRLALGNPQRAFSLTADGRQIFSLARAGGLLERMRQLFGAKLADQMLPFDQTIGGLKVWGLTSNSQHSMPTQRAVLTYVNGRVVRDRLLIRAIANAYATLIPRGRHPVVALFLGLRPEEVDVNVHPMKAEVRFRHSGAVFEAVYRTMRHRLADQVERFPSEPADDRAEQQPRLEPSGDSAAAPSGRSEEAVPFADEPSAPAATGLKTGLSNPGGQGEERRLRLVAEQPGPAAPTQAGLELRFGGADRGASPNGRAGSTTVPRYSELRLIGQLFAGYIVLEDDEGLVLVDQHAAHERVCFERLRAELREGAIRAQKLLVAETVELSPARAAHIHGALPQLSALGFELEPFGSATVVLKASPAVFGAENGRRLLADMLDTMGESGFLHRGRDAFDELLKQLACHGSVRVGRVLELAEMRALLEELDGTEFKANCPHGRPVHVRFARGQLERMFRR